MKIVRISRLTKEVYLAAVSAKEAGADVNPTTLAASFALIADGVPAAYTAGTWETDATVSPSVYYARITIGGTGTGAGIEVAVGTYTAWLKLTGATETPVRPVGLVEVY